MSTALLAEQFAGIVPSPRPSDHRWCEPSPAATRPRFNDAEIERELTALLTSRDGLGGRGLVDLDGILRGSPVAPELRTALSPNRDQPAAGSRPIGVTAVTGQGDRVGSTSNEVAMRPIRTIAPLALGFVALAVAGCQRPDDHGGAEPA